MPHVVVLPPHRVLPPWTDPPDPAEPDRGKVFRLLKMQGFSFGRVDPHGWPWNPFARSHSVLCAIDPLRALRVLLLHRHADVVLCFFESAALVILLCRRLFRFKAKVVVYDIGVAGSWRLRALILRLVVKRADLLLPLASDQREGLLAMGARPDTIRIVRDATCTDFYAATQDRPTGYVLAVGDDVSRDYPTLLEATQDLGTEIVIRSRLVGEDRATFPSVRVTSERLAARDYRALLSGALLVVIPLHSSIHPGGITTLLEAMASAKAVVVSASTGLADYLEDGVNCRIVAPGDPAALRAAILGLIEDEAERLRLGAGARRFVVANCSAEADAEQFAAVLSGLVGG